MENDSIKLQIEWPSGSEFSINFHESTADPSRALKTFQLADLLFVLFDPPLDDLAHHRARRISVSGMIEYLFDLREREA